MKTILRLIALLLAAMAAPVHANSAAVEAVAPQAEPPARPALWIVKDEDTSIYLFGTIHILPEGIDWFGGEVASAFAGSDELVTEIVGDDPAKMQALVAEKALLPADQSLRSLLAEEERGGYEAALAQFGIPPAFLDPFELWYASVALSTMPLMQEGFATENGVEQTLDAKARARQLPHTGLETPEYQLGLFDALPLDVQQRYLGEVIAQLPTIKAQLRSMVDAWKRGKAEELASLMNAGESDPVLVKTLLTDRNAAWARWIDARLDEPGTVFMAVGAGHLAGSGSLQDQLAALGIGTTRLQ